VLVIFGGCAGLCYNALWYFPVLMVVGGLLTLLWDLYGRQKVAALRAKLTSRRRTAPHDTEENHVQSIPIGQLHPASIVQKRTVASQANSRPTTLESPATTPGPQVEPRISHPERGRMDTLSHAIPLTVGLAIIGGFSGNASSRSSCPHC
jgi:hypothetical protein